ncbi:tetratricopeptide repeat protein [Thalassotalea agariperforans]
MKKFITKIKLITLAGIVLPLTAMSADILKTDRLFTEKNYEQAKQGYLEAASLGNPHAYYQLATIYLKGLGVEKDTLNALIYFSLAAEYKFHDAEQIINKMLSNVSPEEKQTLTNILSKFNESNGKQTVMAKYFPIINEKNLAYKVTFEGEPALETKYHSDEYSDNYEESYSTSFSEDGEEEYDDLALLMSTPKQPFIILDHDVAPDGSIRNIADVQIIGFTKSLIDEFKLFPTLKPDFNKRPVDFVNRVYLGAAGYSKFTLLEEDKKLYERIRRAAIKLKASESLNDKYQYAMALQNFPWLNQEDGEIESLLLALSKIGHPAAMYEYGFKLYREQKNIPEAIHWISEASKYGLARAEYRLANILLSSPWVENDEKKALFWFESAMEKNHDAATIKAIDLKLTANDKSLHDLEGAINYLSQIETSQANNPEYYYLLALSHKDRKNRDYTQVIQNLERAISMGQRANWDVSEWQDLLITLTTGRVFISDD